MPQARRPDVYETHYVNFEYTPEEMHALTAAAFGGGNCIDDGGRYDWRAGASVAVWTHPKRDAHPATGIKAIFYDAYTLHSGMSHVGGQLQRAYARLDAHLATLPPTQGERFIVVEHPTEVTYEDALGELGLLELRALGRKVYGR